MIIMNYWHDADYNPTTDGYILDVASIVNDRLSLPCDFDLIKEAIDNDNDFEPEPETLYELQLIRATIDADPVPEHAFVIDRVIRKVYDVEYMTWVTPVVKL